MQALLLLPLLLLLLPVMVVVMMQLWRTCIMKLPCHIRDVVDWAGPVGSPLVLWSCGILQAATCRAVGYQRTVLHTLHTGSPCSC